MAYELLGKNFTPPDVHAKVTGKAKYAEDFRADGMVFVKLLTSPMPHARVTSIDASAALAMPGVHGVLTPADITNNPPAPNETILTDEPLFVGHPILAVAADTEELASDALEQIKVTYEELPFTVDPLQSLFPGGPNARTNGNVVQGREIRDVKWTAQDFAGVQEGQLPQGAPLSEWSFGDIDAGFAAAKVVLDETFVTAGLGHHSMEPRSAFAYWQNGKCYLYGSTQSQSFPLPGIAQLCGVEMADLVYVAEFCGGGFGSKGGAYPLMAIPALMSKKIGRPVMMRISRHEEYFMGSARPGFQGRIKMGFAADGRVTAVDLYIVQENGPNQGFNDWSSAAEAVTIIYQPAAMRFRGVPVMTNTPPRGPQRGPGQNQIAAAVEPLIDKAAKQLGLDRLAIRRINAPDNAAKIGSMQGGVTSAYLKDALDRGAEMFDWAGRQARIAQAANGSKVRGLGVGTAYHSAGGNGFDGLVRILPDGKIHIHTGVGNLGTYSHTATSRVAAEILKANWDNCVVVRGDSSKHLPWNLGQFGSNTSFTMTRTNYVAAMDAVAKLKEIAAMDLGGTPDDYDIGGERVFSKSDSSKGLTYAQAAQRAIELGGKFDGHEVPNDLNAMTKASAAAVAGTGLVGVAKDNLPRVGTVPALAAGFIEIELDTETGKFEILDYVGVADCGTVLHPQGLAHQIKSGAVMGLGLAASERHIYDPQNGLPGNIGLLQAKPVSYLDVPATMQTAWIDIADAQNPVGAKGIGEPVQGCAAAALLCAISDALGGHYFNRTPVMADMIVNAAAKRPQSHRPLQVNTA
jgi:xanthine dehydrogenase molybdenum-binding subunit